MTLYVISHILSEPIGMLLKNETWASANLQGDTVGDLDVVFAWLQTRGLCPLKEPVMKKSRMLSRNVSELY